MIFLLSFVVPFLSLFSIYFDQFILFQLLPVFYIFFIIPVLDLRFRPNVLAPSKNQSELILYTVCFFYLFVFSYFLTTVSSFNWLTLVIVSINMGFSGGVIAINAAHEIGHRNSKYEKWFAKLLLFSTSYYHFQIEHNKGHHKNVATPSDPATALLNMSLYNFLPKTILGSLKSAFQIASKGKPFYKNEVLWALVVNIMFILLCAVVSLKIAVAFCLHSFISILLLEIVNYIEHYGLLRNYSNGRYEKVTTAHSWNSDHFFSRVHLFNLSFHSDHHAFANKPYYELQSIKDSPQMPFGYAGMMLISLIPPLWFKIMHKEIKKLSDLT